MLSLYLHTFTQKKKRSFPRYTPRYLVTGGRGGGAAVAARVGAEGGEPHGPALVPDTGQWSLLHREVGHY